MSENDKPLAGKVALVSGAGQNIGRAIAETLAADGAFVAVNGRSNPDNLQAVADEIQAAGGQAMAQPAQATGTYGGGSAGAGGPARGATVRRMPPPGVAVDPNNPETWGKVARNAPCPCGSGKKYKQCHGKL